MRKECCLEPIPASPIERGGGVVWRQKRAIPLRVAEGEMDTRLREEGGRACFPGGPCGWRVTACLSC